MMVTGELHWCLIFNLYFWCLDLGRWVSLVPPSESEIFEKVGFLKSAI